MYLKRTNTNMDLLAMRQQCTTVPSLVLVVLFSGISFHQCLDSSLLVSESLGSF